MDFCTTINCMDGRTQLPVNEYLRRRFKATYVDTITEPGPNLILAKQTSLTLVKSILDRIEISVHHHHSEGIAVVGHHGCAGNPAGKEEQLSHLKDAVHFLKNYYADKEIIALWVDENWRVTEMKME